MIAHLGQMISGMAEWPNVRKGPSKSARREAEVWNSAETAASVH